MGQRYRRELRLSFGTCTSALTLPHGSIDPGRARLSPSWCSLTLRSETPPSSPAPIQLCVSKLPVREDDTNTRGKLNALRTPLPPRAPAASTSATGDNPQCAARRTRRNADIAAELCQLSGYGSGAAAPPCRETLREPTPTPALFNAVRTGARLTQRAGSAERRRSAQPRSASATRPRPASRPAPRPRSARRGAGGVAALRCCLLWFWRVWNDFFYYYYYLQTSFVSGDSAKEKMYKCAFSLPYQAAEMKESSMRKLLCTCASFSCHPKHPQQTSPWLLVVLEVDPGGNWILQS